MSTILLAMMLIFCAAMVVAAVIAIHPARSLPIAILASGSVGLFASVLFLLLAGPDVAMTEAAIGSGLTTFLFFFVLRRVKGGS